MKPIICGGFTFSDVGSSLSALIRREGCTHDGVAAGDRIGHRREGFGGVGAIARSRMEPASRVERARMLLAYREDASFFAVAQGMGVHHQTVQRCVERALAYGPIAALNDRPRPGKEPTITAEAKTWVVNLACRKAKVRY